MKLRALVIGALIVVVVGVAGYEFVAFWDPCSNQIVRALGSPDNKFKAILFERDCGATTGFSSQISVLRAAERLHGAGNTFIADERQNGPIGSWGGPLVSFRWRNANHLEIEYYQTARIFKKENSTRNIAIQYAVRH